MELRTSKHPSHAKTSTCLLPSSNTNIAVPVNASLRPAALILRSAPNCLVLFVEQLADNSWHSRPTKAQSVLSQWTTERGQSEGTEGKETQAAFSLIIYAVHPPFSVIVWFRAIVWEWAFTGYNNVITWFAVSRASSAQSLKLPFPRCGTVVLGFTGELFTVAPLILAIVSELLMTDSATMEIKMETLCQCDTHANCKFMGPEVRNGPWWGIKKVIKSWVSQTWVDSDGSVALLYVTDCVNIVEWHSPPQILNCVWFIYKSQTIFPLPNFITCVATDVYFLPVSDDYN